MEQWQFLIQKQGDRNWQSLESPYVEIIEGRYRVVARSSRANTDVEVRVTHISPWEIPPRRRIHKRLRRTNNEGLMAVIPFTYFAPGVWEVRCSGDLMSDVLGTSWQHTLKLQVLPQGVASNHAPESDDGEDNVDSSLFAPAEAENTSLRSQISPVSVDSHLPIPPVPPNFATSTPVSSRESTNAEIVSPPEKPASNQDQQIQQPDIIDITAEVCETPLGDAEKATIPTEKINNRQHSTDIDIDFDIDIDAIIRDADLQPENIIDHAGEDFATNESQENTEIATEITTENIIGSSEQSDRQLQLSLEQLPLEPLQPFSVNEIDAESLIFSDRISLEPTEIIDNEDYLESANNINYPRNIDEHISQEHEQNASDKIDDIPREFDEPIRVNTSNLRQTKRPDIPEETIKDFPISPVWVKGDTAEQILHNLIELALPATEPLLAEEKVAESLKDDAQLPLSLMLVQHTYIAHWGESLTIDGRVQLKETNDAAEFESVAGGELRLELRSPYGKLISGGSSQELEVLMQVQQALPEKLLPFEFDLAIKIPADCQSKLLLVDISFYGALGGVGDVELLASQSFTIAADVSDLLAVSTAVKPTEPDMLDYGLAQMTPEPAVSIDLELFNLVKSAKNPQPLVVQPSPKRALPLEIESRKLLPNTWEISSHAHDLASEARCLPFLRKRPVQSLTNSIDNMEKIVNQEMVTTTSNDLEMVENQKSANEMITDELHTQNQGNLQTQDNSAPQLIYPPVSGENTLESRPFVSPLIRKWMESQGYSGLETIDFNYQNYNINIPTATNISAVHVSETNHHEPENIDEELSNEVVEETILEPDSGFNSDLSTDINSELNSDVNSQENADLNFALNSDVTSQENADLNYQENDDLALIPEPHILEVTEQNQPAATNTPISQSWLAQEIVVDDDIVDDISNYIRTENETIPNSNKQPDQELVSSVADVLSCLGLNLDEEIESLPIPQLSLPTGELVSGKMIRVRVVVPEIRPQTAVKLWVEDCQTRWLLEGPHILTDLLPNSFGGGMEALAEINIPFGCLEIRIEAIAIDIVSQQESHKASIQRTVIPPDLPNLQMDELLGI
ncbi:hypothetical protein NIES4101_88880 [Calothrix sp. NIES-4101]|nr:hypothetical protein NIES4101_88880 [Calothrix sp. NIES-4101]